MSFRGRDDNEVGNPNKMNMGEPRRFGGMDNDRSMNDEMDDRRFDAGRGRRPPFGRGRGPSPPGRDRNRSEFGFGRDERSSMRDRSPVRGSDDRFSDRYKKDDGNSFMKRDDRDRRDGSGRPFYGEDSHRDRFMDKSRLEGPSGFDSRFDGPGGDPYKSRPMNYPGAPPPKMFAEGFPKPNECEIIAVNKHQRGYAESVEARVKAIGIVVDVLFLKDEALLTQTIDDIARRGSLYAMVISPQNETHGSITVNILHGTPQEHRNMPLEDALKLLSQNFHKHIRMQRENMERERAERGPYVGNVAADREIQFLLRMLADGRWLSEPELSTVIRYLSERRDKMAENAEEDRRLGRAPIPPAKVDPPYKMKDDLDVARKEQDLQDRIMNIMNQGVPPQVGSQGASLSSNSMSNQSSRLNANDSRSPSMLGSNMPGLKSLDDKLSSQSNVDTGSGLGDTDVKPFASSRDNDSNSTPSTFINFGDPSVQKALDNLIQTGPNILKNITSSLSSTAQSSILGDVSKPPISSTGMGSSNDSMGMQRDNIGTSRGPGGLSDIGSGSGPRGLSDIGSGSGPRGTGNLDMGLPRGPMGISDLGRSGPPPRNLGSDIMSMGPPSRGGFGGMNDMGSRDFGGNMQDSGMSQQSRMQDMGRMGPPRSGGNIGMGPSRDMPPSRGMGMGNDFPLQNQFSQFKGPGGQHGNFPGGSYNSGSGMGNMRQNYGNSQGMGGGPRRY